MKLVTDADDVIQVEIVCFFGANDLKMAGCNDDDHHSFILEMAIINCKTKKI